MNKTNYILPKDQTIVDKYKVAFFLKKGSYAETYRVKDQEGKLEKKYPYTHNYPQQGY